MPLTCVYHKTKGMRVVPLDEQDKLMATGEWFDHPSCNTDKEESKHEKPIRQRTRKRRSDAEHTPTPL